MEILDGRKIPREYENPIDDQLLLLCDKMVDFCIKYKITPNQISLFRFYFIFIIYYYLFNTNNYVIPIIFISLFYYFDCLDGHLARSTNNITVLGDLLDHIADHIHSIIIFYYLYKNKYYKLFLFILFMSYLVTIHMDLQQKQHKILKPDEATNEFLDLCKYINPLDNDHIIWTKYFGAGTYIFIILCIVYYIQINK